MGASYINQEWTTLTTRTGTALATGAIFTALIKWHPMLQALKAAIQKYTLPCQHGIPIKQCRCALSLPAIMRKKEILPSLMLAVLMIETTESSRMSLFL